jgi:hypothetical protein
VQHLTKASGASAGKKIDPRQRGAFRLLSRQLRQTRVREQHLSRGSLHERNKSFLVVAVVISCTAATDGFEKADDELKLFDERINVSVIGSKEDIRTKLVRTEKREARGVCCHVLFRVVEIQTGSGRVSPAHRRVQRLAAMMSGPDRHPLRVE